MSALISRTISLRSAGVGLSLRTSVDNSAGGILSQATSKVNKLAGFDVVGVVGGVPVHCDDDWLRVDSALGGAGDAEIFPHKSTQIDAVKNA